MRQHPAQGQRSHWAGRDVLGVQDDALTAMARCIKAHGQQPPRILGLAALCRQPCSVRSCCRACCLPASVSQVMSGACEAAAEGGRAGCPLHAHSDPGRRAAWQQGMPEPRRRCEQWAAHRVAQSRARPQSTGGPASRTLSARCPRPACPAPAAARSRLPRSAPGLHRCTGAAALHGRTPWAWQKLPSGDAGPSCTSQAVQPG